jgi:urease accessory protein
LWHDAIRLEGDVATTLRRKAIADGARAVATIVHVAPKAEATLDAVRSALHVHLARLAGEVDAQSAAGEGKAPPHLPDVTKAAASAWNGMLITRILAPSGATLRTTVIAVLTALRDDRPLQRVWMC